MNALTFFLLFIPLLSFILLIINKYLATHNPNKDKDSPFECGFTSFIQMSRMAFTISFFIFGLLFLLFDLELLLMYPWIVTTYNNDIYGFTVAILFLLLISLGFIYEIGNNALRMESRQMNYKSYNNYYNYSLRVLLKKILKKFYIRYKRAIISLSKHRYFESALVLMIFTGSYLVKVKTRPYLCNLFDEHYIGWVIYFYYFLLGVITVYLLNRVQNTNKSFKDCLLLQTENSIKVLVIFWLLVLFFSIFHPYEIIGYILPYVFNSHVHRCLGPIWNFSNEGMAQLTRGYIHPSDKMKIGNLVTYGEGSSVNQPAGREIYNNLKNVGYYGKGWTYSNPHLPDIVQSFLKERLKHSDPETYHKAMEESGRFVYTTPRITEKVARDLKSLE